MKKADEVPNNLYTICMYHMKVEGKLGNARKSAELCHTTLDRQLLAHRELLDWKGRTNKDDLLKKVKKNVILT
jgi:hypothetical protein